MTVVLVTGGRFYANSALVESELDKLHPSKIIHGGACGADALAEAYADRRGITKKAYPAKWTLHGRAAGPIRNQRMLDWESPDIVLAFPGGDGTADCVDRAKRMGIPVIEVRDPSEPTQALHAAPRARARRRRA